jgi:hypothetical protein
MNPVRAALLTALALTAIAPGAAPLAAQDQPDVQTEAEAAAPSEGEARLARMLEGRVAGDPVRCIRTLPSQRMETIERTAYVYGSGQTIYVQRTRNPDQISTGDALITNRFNGSQLCRLDQVTTVDRVLGFFTGAVFFEDFVPYTRAKTEGSDEG